MNVSYRILKLMGKKLLHITNVYISHYKTVRIVLTQPAYCRHFVGGSTGDKIKLKNGKYRERGFENSTS